jgi:hypothetical protein
MVQAPKRPTKKPGTKVEISKQRTKKAAPPKPTSVAKSPSTVAAAA